jgi:CDP-2,3-bis-(O-geranylgeranyl)-sn-glycerol synthase
MNLLVAFLIGIGAMAGDLAGSFLKRRMGLQRGNKAPFFLDTINFVIGVIVFTFLFVDYTIGMILIMLLITPIIHRITNIFGYLLKFKREPW